MVSTNPWQRLLTDPGATTEDVEALKEDLRALAASVPGSKRISRLPRWMHRAYARLAGYFWLPCPLCRRPFGGHEWREIDCLPATIPGPKGTPNLFTRRHPGYSVCICPACTRAGLGSDTVRVADWAEPERQE